MVSWAGNSLLPSVLNAIGGALQFIGAVIGSAWDAILKPFIDAFLVPIAKWTGGVIVSVLNGIGDGMRAVAQNKALVEFIAGLTVGLTAFVAALKAADRISTFNSGIKTMQAVLLSNPKLILDSANSLGTLKTAFVLAGGGANGLKAAAVALAGSIKTTLIGAFNAVMAHPFVLGVAGIIAGVTFAWKSLSAAVEAGEPSTWKSEAAAKALATAQERTKAAVEGLKTAEDNLTNARNAKVDSEIAYNQAIDQQKQAQENLNLAVQNSGISYESLRQAVDNGSLSYGQMNEQQQLVYNAGLQLDSANNQVKTSQDTLNQSIADAKTKAEEYKLADELLVAQLEADAIAQGIIDGKYKNTDEAIKALKDGTLEYKDENGNMVKANSEDVSKLEGTIREKTGEILKSYNDSMTGADKGFFGPMGKSLSQASQWTKDFVDGAKQKIGEWCSDLGQKAKDAKKGLEDGIGNLAEWGSQKWNDLKGAFSNAWQTFKDIGSNILKGLSDGIGNMGQWLKDKFNGAVDGIKNFLGIKSPSRLFKSIGGYMSEGLAIGYDSNLGSIISSTEEMSDVINKSLNIPNIDSSKYQTSIGHTLTADLSDAIQSNPINLTVNLGNEKLIDQTVNGINERSFLDNRSIINI